MHQPPAGRERLPGSGRPEPGRPAAGREHPRPGDGRTPGPPAGDREHSDPDVLLDVPVVKVEEIDLEVDDLRARVALEARVLDLLSLDVGADVALGRVKLTIKGVEAQALLKVRLDNVEQILRRVLETIDANPEILTNLTRGLGGAVGEVGQGAGRAVQDVGSGAGGAVRDVGSGAGRAVEDVGSGAGEAVQDVGSGAGEATKDVGAGAGQATKDVGSGAGEATKGAGEAAKDVGSGAGEATKDVGSGAGEAAKGAGEATKGAGEAAKGAGEVPKDAGPGAGDGSGGEPQDADRHEPHDTADLATGELAGALAKKSVEAGRGAAGRIADAMRRIAES